MTTRRIYFRSDSGKYYCSPLFIGDRTELLESASPDTCDLDWPDLKRSLEDADTLPAFLHAVYEIESHYHRLTGDLPGTRIAVQPYPPDRADEVYAITPDHPGPALDVVLSCAHKAKACAP